MLDLQFEQLSIRRAAHPTELQRCWGTVFRLGRRGRAGGISNVSRGDLRQTCTTTAVHTISGIHEAADGADSAHYEFGHALHRQALYRRLSSLNRSKLHRSLGEAAHRSRFAGKRELASEVALHFEEGRDYEQAAHCLMLAAENAARRFAHGDSIRVLQHALELTPWLAPRARTELEVEILQRIGDAHYALGAISDSAFAFKTAADRATECGLRKAQIIALSRLALPAWYLDPELGNQICEQAIEISRTHPDQLLLARTQLAAACFRLLYDTWREEDAQTCASARQTIRHLSASSMPEDVLYPYVQLIQGDYTEALEQAEAGMIAATSPAAYLLSLGAKTLVLIGLGRFGELLRIIRSGRELAEKNGEDPWVFIFREAWLRSLCFDFEGVRRLSEIIMRSNAEQHASQPKTMAMIASGYAELYQGRCEEALQYFARVRDPKITPKFLFHWRWRMRAQLGTVEARLQAGDLVNARTEVDDFLQAALSTGEPNLHAFAGKRARESLWLKRIATSHFSVSRAHWQFSINLMSLWSLGGSMLPPGMCSGTQRRMKRPKDIAEALKR